MGTLEVSEEPELNDDQKAVIAFMEAAKTAPSVTVEPETDILVEGTDSIEMPVVSDAVKELHEWLPPLETADVI